MVRAEHLRTTLETALQSATEPRTAYLAGRCRPPISLPRGLTTAGADDLISRTWPEPTIALLTQQISEPAEERRIRGRLPSLTPVDDAVSQAVRQQYEENPYPRWIKLPPAAKALSLGSYLRGQFPYAPHTLSVADERLDIMVAGCGTGQESIETAQQFPARNRAGDGPESRQSGLREEKIGRTRRVEHRICARRHHEAGHDAADVRRHLVGGRTAPS